MANAVINHNSGLCTEIKYLVSRGAYFMMFTDPGFCQTLGQQSYLTNGGGFIQTKHQIHILHCLTRRTLDQVIDHR